MLAARVLTRAGFVVLEHGYSCRIGEIDLIATEKETLVFIEVKYRRSDRFGDPAEAVTPAKQKTIRRVAAWYCAAHRVPQDTPLRFDVVAIQEKGIRLIRDAF